MILAGKGAERGLQPANSTIAVSAKSSRFFDLKWLSY